MLDKKEEYNNAKTQVCMKYGNTGLDKQLLRHSDI